MADSKTTQRQAAKLVIARESFLAPGGVSVPKGTVLEAGDKLAKRYPGLFEPAEQRLRTTRRA